MKFKINKYLIDDIENKDHPSDFEVVSDYSILILRLPFIDKEAVEVVSYAFLIKDGKVYKYDRKTKEFEMLGTFSDLYDYLDTRIDKILAKISKLHIAIAKMEDELYENDMPVDFSNNWLKFKKELVLIERLMGHSLIAFERFIKYYKNSIDELAFKDLAEHIDRAFRFSKNAIEKLDYLYEFFKAKQDEKMNNIMFILTILSAIFLPLTLITGFFGMNTGGLPFTQDPSGTLKAIGISLLFEVPFVFFIWKMMKS
ncbi:magnesium transporter [Nautilia sp. PV-1]|uniref:magnesium transporter CorA family protein n=1 Tax=Nautilia sp. PV-1 TaxID=2579250 RepID=UPI000FDCA343|nr:CorA family divalent cation transporter [Nautilia sp. PV-1]AZV46374.1 magnesium transporter [Nautilia sp. PV-1]